MYSCQHCGREYKIKSYYNRHITTCKILHKTSKELRDDEEYLADTPKIRELYDIILEMNTQIKTLQRKIKKLENTHQEKQRKINIIEWLTTQYKPSIYWEDWLDTLVFSRKHLELVFQEDIIAALLDCLNHKCEEKDDLQNVPMRVFEQKQNAIFVYCQLGWKQIYSKDMEKVVCLLHKKCMQEFMKWETEAENQMSSSEFTSLFTERIHKINSKTTSYVSKRLFQKLYDTYKINIKSIINIEIE